MRSYSTAEDAEDGDAAVRFGLGATVPSMFVRARALAGLSVAAGCLSRPVCAQDAGHRGQYGAAAVARAAPVLEEGGALRGSFTGLGAGSVAAVLEQARYSQLASLHAFELADGKSLDVLVEPLRAARRLVIFGGGHDAQPLVRMARLQGLHVTLIDSRAHFARASRFTDAHVVLHKDLTGRQPDAAAGRRRRGHHDPQPAAGCLLAGARAALLGLLYRSAGAA
ncbi:XdhC family protein [Halopseudomonas pachastrellae]|nr:XdhC family protein [Halopseudomonas pachastrellae]